MERPGQLLLGKPPLLPQPHQAGSQRLIDPSGFLHQGAFSLLSAQQSGPQLESNLTQKAGATVRCPRFFLFVQSVFLTPQGQLLRVPVVQGVESAPGLHVVGQLMGEGGFQLLPPGLPVPVLLFARAAKEP